MGVGLDIGSKTVKFVQIDTSGGSLRLKASGIAGYKGKAPEFAKDEKELVPLIEAIKKLHKESKISSREVVIALPENQVYTRTIKFPLLTDEEIASAVKWEAEQYVPIPIEDAIIQHQIVERKTDTTPAQAVVLLVAAPKPIVEKYAKVVDSAGMTLKAAETELMSLTRALAPAEQTVMLVDFGAQATDIAVSKNGQLMFSRSVATSGDAFTRAISQNLSVSEQQAEEYKRAYGMSATHLEGRIKKALDPIFRIITDEIIKAVHFYQSEEKGDSPQSVILSGGSVGMPELVTTLAKLLGIEVVVGNPFAKVTVDPSVVSTLSGYAHFYSIAVGLAMRA